MFLGFAGYLILWKRFAPPGHMSGIKVRTLTRALLPPFAMLALANGPIEDAIFYGPFVVASAAVIAFSLDTGVFRLERFGPAVRALGAAGIGALAWAIVVLIPWLIQANAPLGQLAAALAVVVLVSLLNIGIELRGTLPDRPREWTALRFVLSFLAAGAVLGLQALGIVAAWSPAWSPRW